MKHGTRQLYAAVLLCLSLVACGGGASDSTEGQSETQSPTLSFAQQREKLEGSWTQQCATQVDHGSGQLGPQYTLNKVAFVGPDASGVIRVLVKTEFHASAVSCYTYDAAPYATVTWGDIELKFAFTGYLAATGEGPVDVYAVSQPSRTISVTGTQGVSQNSDGSWIVTFSDGKSVDIPAQEDIWPAQLGLHVYGVNNTPNVQMTFNGYGPGGDPSFIFKRDGRSY